MSKALDYLLASRPEAMQTYFSFLKQAGTHLDAKTAALISVITKVHAKTANGLRQYLPRALKAGAKADEIIDALLFAMPALGFSKIVWAIDVIIEMDLPEFKLLDSGTPQGKWEKIAEVSTLTEGEPRFVKAGRQPCYVVMRDNKITIFDGFCPHKGSLIPESGLRDGKLTCPFHDWSFELHEGRCVSGNTSTLKRVPYKIEGDNILIEQPCA
jgi:nitrite reductase/ring-hydroxylating ferredoxin subunit/alkylhydroperoxidase/carboxymuconolactone decarboxylase family protein YurZ